MVILFTTYGIGNRLRVIASAEKICKETNHKLIIIWPKENDLNAGYYDLFEKDEHRVISIRCNKYLHNFLSYFFKYNRSCNILNSLIINGDFILKNQGEKLYKYFYHKKIILLRTCYELGKFYNINNIKFNIKNVVQNSILYKKAHINNKNLVGVHIRRTDNVWSSENSPTVLFITHIRNLLKNNPNLMIYIASDDPKTKEDFISEFGDKIIIQPITSYNRNDKNGVIEAAIELYNLSVCNIILGSYGSSFSDIASKMGGKSLYIISDDINRKSKNELKNLTNIRIPQLTKREWIYYYLHFIQRYKH